MANVESYLDELIESTNAKNTLVQALKDGRIAVGDYVSYTPDAHDPITVGTDETGFTNEMNLKEGTDQTFSQNPNTTWRVLGLSEDGEHVLLTTGSPIKADGADPYLVLQGSTGAANCVTVLNKISGLYHNSSLAEETRSITMADIERVIEGTKVIYPEEGELKIEEITVTYPQEGESGTGKVTITATETVYDAEGNSESQTSTAPMGATTEYSSYDYKFGDYTLTNPPQLLTADQSSEVETYSMAMPTGQSIDANAYMLEYENFLQLDIRESNMLFAGTKRSDKYAKSYWLASPGIYAGSNVAIWFNGAVYDGYAGNIGITSGLFATNNEWGAFGHAVRPVVVLKSNVTIDQVQKIEDQEEEVWTTTGGESHKYIMPQ